jgi:VTC domain
VILQPNNGVPSVAGLCEAGSSVAGLCEAGLTEASYRRAVSPALDASAGLDAPAYELKFLLTEARAAEVESRARREMVTDPHANSIGANYRTTSLYCDTPQFDVFHRRGLYRRRKHRLRRYGRAPWVYLERKTKWGDRVKKVRTPIRDGELPLLELPMSAPTWPGHWFHRHLTRRRLAPVCRLTYDRVALVGESALGAFRLTFDRGIHGTLTNGWELRECDGGLPILTGEVICEFKFRSCLPMLFKDIIRAMQLVPSRVSKFRGFLRASGRVADGQAVDA